LCCHHSLPWRPPPALHCKRAIRDHEYCVYILANTFHLLYTGVTNNLSARVKQHKAEKNPHSFTARYGINHLVYFERFQYIHDAIHREKQIEGWLRIKKIALIVQHNPTWRDLSEDWGKPTEPFDESKMRPPETF
jgi:putative endonuclease